MDKREDRRVEIESELANYGFTEKSERFRAIETPGFGILGCGKSHLEVFKLARERKYKNVLIFEDDVYFENDLFLTTNFKQDKINVQWPHSVVYKLYEPLPDEYRTLDECIVVKQMLNPYEDTIKIVDFVPEETPSLVLKSPDMQNVESPIKKRSTSYKTESDILTADKTISNNLRNSFLSQSFESVEINTDFSQYKNFVNFGSIEKRVRNFKLKLEQIEDNKISSASYIGVSGSLKEKNLYHYRIEDIKNKLDSFE